MHYSDEAFGLKSPKISQKARTLFFYQFQFREISIEEPADKTILGLRVLELQS